MSTQSKIIKGIIYVFLIFLALIYLLPLLWVVITSLKDDAVLMSSPWALPERPMFENYSFAWTMGIWVRLPGTLLLYVLSHLFYPWCLAQWLLMQLQYCAGN